MTKKEKELYRTIRNKWGRPNVDCFGEDSWRVILWDVHVDHGVTSGQLSGHGSTFAEAMHHLLDEASRAKFVGDQSACHVCRNASCY